MYECRRKMSPVGLVGPHEGNNKLQRMNWLVNYFPTTLYALYVPVRFACVTLKAKAIHFFSILKKAKAAGCLVIPHWTHLSAALVRSMLHMLLFCPCQGGYAGGAANETPSYKRRRK